VATALAERSFVIESYDRLSHSFRQFQESGEVVHLSDALDQLCKTLGTLNNDQQFWAHLINLFSDARLNDELMALTGDLEQHLADDADAVIEGGYSDPALVLRLASDVGVALNLLRQAKSGEAFSNLQQRLAAFEKEVCGARLKGKKKANRKWTIRAARLVARGISIIAGIGFIVVNAVTVAHAPHPVTVKLLFKSLASGASAVTSGLP